MRLIGSRNVGRACDKLSGLRLAGLGQCFPASLPPLRVCEAGPLDFRWQNFYKLISFQPTPVTNTSMVIRIASAVLSLAGLLALVSGIAFWSGIGLNLMALHMLLGILAVGALWTIGIGQAFSSSGSWIIAASALILGALTIVLGLYQSSLMIGAFHWVVEVLHLTLGILTIGLGHMGAACYRKRAAR